MTFSTAKGDDVSRRFHLVRIRPAWHLGDELTLESTLYQMTWGTSLKLAGIERNGTALTEVTSTPSTNDTYQLTSDGTLKVKLASAPDDDTNNVVAFFYLFFTTHGEDQIATLDPEDSETAEVLWEARLESNAQIRQSFENVIEGIFSIGDLALGIDNTEHDLEDYLTSDHSWNRAEVVIWQCINNESNIRRIYTGQGTSLSKGAGSLTFDVADTFNRLTQPATMGDSPDEAYFRRESGSFPNMDPNLNGTPCRMHFGAHSRVETKGYENVSVGLKTFANHAVCTDFSTSISSTTNREWGLCRIPKGYSLKTPTFGTVTSSSLVFPVWQGSATGHNLEVGDSFKVEDPNDANNSGYVTIIHVDGNDMEGFFALSDQSGDLSGLDETYTHTPFQAPALQISRGTLVPYFFAYQTHFTFSEVTTSGGNKYLSVTLADGVEDDLFVLNAGTSDLDASDNPINPSIHQLAYRVSLVSDHGHSEILQLLLEKSGMEVDSTSFAAAQTALDVDALFSIPNSRETDFAPYLKYCQDILRSTLGYLTVNTEGKVEYQLLEAPSSAEVTDDSELWDLEVESDYEDIVTAIVAVNEDLQNEDEIENQSQKVENAKAKYLHGIDKTIRMSHVLTDISTRLADILAVRSSPRNIYRFRTATRHLDAALGDDLQLDHAEVLGGTDSVDLKVIGLEKDGTETKVEASDLGQLT